MEEGTSMITFLKRLLYEPALFFGFGTAVLASAAGFWENAFLAFAAAAFAIAGGFVTRSQTITKKHAATLPDGFVDLSNT